MSVELWREAPPAARASCIRQEELEALLLSCISQEDGTQPGAGAGEQPLLPDAGGVSLLELEGLSQELELSLNSARSWSWRLSGRSWRPLQSLAEFSDGSEVRSPVSASRGAWCISRRPSLADYTHIAHALSPYLLVYEGLWLLVCEAVAVDDSLSPSLPFFLSLSLALLSLSLSSLSLSLSLSPLVPYLSLSATLSLLSLSL